MLDLKISNGTLVDGSGRPRHVSDLGISGGRIVEVGDVDSKARRTLDADGLMVAPGFIDVHTHYDAQVFWDTTLSPSPLHGVTTVFSGNCGFTLFPLAPEDRDYMLRMLARVEGMPISSLEVGVPWGSWSSTAEYFDQIDRTLTPNIGFMIGHSALRRAVMKDDAVGMAATQSQIGEMRALLRDALCAGAIGLSSTRSPSHNDHHGNPVPSRSATRDELLALCEVVGAYPGTSLEFLPGIPPFDDEVMDLVASMSRTAGRCLNWNAIDVVPGNQDVLANSLSISDYANRAGGRVVGLAMAQPERMRLNFRSGFVLDLLPGWDTFMALPDAAKLGRIADVSARAEMGRIAQTASPTLLKYADWSLYTILETRSQFLGRQVGEIARDLGTTSWNALMDIVLGDELDTVVGFPVLGDDHGSWARRAEVWLDPRVVVGASDAGAHLDMIDSFNYSTTLLSEGVRARGLLSWEEAIRLLADEPARLYGLHHRGRIQEGWWADLVIFDPASVGPEPVATRNDLPAGGGRLYGSATGIHHVLVAGVEAVTGGECTDARPGRVLRSGTDTTTQPLAA